MRRARILIVDDEPAMLRSVERILTGEYKVRGSSSPVAAIEVAREFHPQLAVVDIRMPGMDGYELMNELKRLDERIHVILMTGSVYDVDEQLIRAIREDAFYYIGKPFDREVLRTLVQRSVKLRALEDADRRHMAHLESQLAEARTFQETMIPPRRATIHGIDIFAEYAPCAELAGDLYDYAPAGDGGVILLIADVVGHGASAAMLTGIVKSAFHSSHVDDYEPLAVVRRVADGIAVFEPNRFVTMICARISVTGDVVEYVNAGHEGGLISTPEGAVIPLSSTGPLISPVISHLEWKQEAIQYNRESSILLYTDGIADALEREECSGSERILTIVRHSPMKGSGLLENILKEAMQPPPHRSALDDMTLLTAHRNR